MPTKTPVRVSPSTSSARHFAIPKSVTTAREVGISIRTLGGLTSRWTTPARCAQASADAICRPMRSTSASGTRPSLRISAPRLSPCTSSIAIQTPKSGSLPMSKTRATFGWLSRAMTSASRRKRATIVGSLSSPARICLRANEAFRPSCTDLVHVAHRTAADQPDHTIAPVDQPARPGGRRRLVAGRSCADHRSAHPGTSAGQHPALRPARGTVRARATAPRGMHGRQSCTGGAPRPTSTPPREAARQDGWT